MTSSPEVLIVGGGVIGLTCAYYLAREGVGVEVLDKGNFGGEASWAGAGILAPGNAEPHAHPVELLRAKSVAAFPDLSTELRECTGIDNGYIQSGGLEFADFAGRSEIGRELDVESEWRTAGTQCKKLGPDELHALEPELVADLLQGYHLPGMAQLRNPRHLKALTAACHLRGVQLAPGCTVLRAEKNGDRILSVETTAGSRRADRFLLAAGAWSDCLLRQVGWRSGVRPVRGQIALLRLSRPLFRRILVQGSRYLVPRPDGRVLIGSTEEDVGFDKRTTAGAIGELLQFGTRLIPALADAHLETCWSGLRPGSPDGLPILGRVPGYDNLYLAAGHYRAGIQLSPGTAEAIRALLLGHRPSLPLEAFSPARFARPSA